MPIEQHAVASSIPGIPGRSIRVWTPPGYRDDAAPLPALYLHDGQNVFAPGGPFGCWHAERSADHAVRSGILPPFLIVAIDNDGANRRREYVPPGHQYRDTAEGVADRYGTFVTGDVMPFVRDRYRVTDDPARTAIAGSSLGGVISLYMGFTTGLFGAVGSFSTAICWAPRFAANLAGQPHRPTRIYHDIGGREAVNMAPDNYWEVNHALHRSLQALGYREPHALTFVVDPDGEHNEAAWARRFPFFLNWLWSPKESAS